MLSDEQYLWLELISKKGLSPRVIKKLFEHFKSVKKISQATPEELIEIGAHKNVLDSMSAQLDIDIGRLEKVMKTQGIKLLCLSDNQYPALLKEIPDPPPILFYKGEVSALSNELYALSVVGSRKCTTYAKNVIIKLFDSLKSYNFCIVSGFAYGVDTIAHKVALDADMPTVAVLGSGVADECIYPAQNRQLMSRIIQKGGIIMSEFFPWQKALPQFFVKRNRIIAGLSKATLVIEAGYKSGALITAEMALSFSRDVAAIPGSIFSDQSFGTNTLLSEGAVLVQSSRDILAMYDLEEKNTLAISQKLNIKERKILELLQEKKYSVDELADLTNFTIQEIHSMVSILEINGLL